MLLVLVLLAAPARATPTPDARAAVASVLATLIQASDGVIGVGDTAVLALAEAYARIAPAGHDARARVLHARARIYQRHDRLADALPLHLAVLADHRASPVAEYAALLALDAYQRLGRHDELLALVAALAADRAFLATKPALADVVRRLAAVGEARGTAACLERARQTGAPAAFEACAERYLATYRAAPTGPASDEALYNAAVTLAEAGLDVRALATFQQLARAHPHSPLNARALLRRGQVAGRLGQHGEAADALATYALRHPDERDADDALVAAIGHRLQQADVPGAIVLGARFLALVVARL